MLENFIKSLNFLGINTENTKHTACEKMLYKFEDENINKHWLCFYRFYQTGYTDACNKIGILAIQEIQPKK